ncbi:protein-disulfide isomerase [Sphingomonas vulcanisoli]|uniref:Protein-disulfide isomerase n=1 Tax=Sphingomonas vulcanisoli TaxID=1658060 RepID=A0ABX0TU61_9SPHN|nr:thioredoxin domain-containing protein [Sphingomonas vulcanisoli]NIJ08264.1 protein-disulfide isomerase [Sphingomonas vulcanisoli]
MKARSLALAATAFLALAACGKKQDTPSATTDHVTAAAVPPPAGKSWTDVVSVTPEGGVRMGNPDAPVKIVEYASFTCPHCKKFEDEGGDALPQKYVSTGKVSYEFRSFLIHGPDAPITLLMMCRGAEPFFALTKQIYAGQDAFMAPLIAMTPADNQALQGLPPQQQFQKLLDTMGLFPWFAARGLPRAQAEKCLADQKAQDQLSATQDRAQTKDGVNQTPSFFLNGVLQSDVSTWPALDAKLTQMIG